MNVLILTNLKLGRRRHRPFEYVAVVYAIGCQLIQRGLAIAGSPPAGIEPTVNPIKRLKAEG